MKAMRRWIKRAFFMQNEMAEKDKLIDGIGLKLLDLKSKNERLMSVNEGIKECLDMERKAYNERYIRLAEHNTYLQANIDSLCQRLEEECDS